METTILDNLSTGVVCPFMVKFVQNKSGFLKKTLSESTSLVS